MRQSHVIGFLQQRGLNVSDVASLDESLEETLTLNGEATDRNNGSIAMNHRS